MIYKISLLLLSISLFAATAAAQARGAIVSGDYEGIMIAVDSKGDLTGYFSSGTGDDGQGNPRFSCIFFIYGEKQTNGSYKVSTWYPGEPEDDVVTGTLKLVGKGAKTRINLKLNGEHGGCWNVAPVLQEDSGVDYELTTPMKWEGVRVISSAKAYFFMSPEAKAPQKIFVVKNDPVKILSMKGEWAEVSFAGVRGRTTTGWMKTSEFFAIKPPAK